MLLNHYLWLFNFNIIKLINYIQIEQWPPIYCENYYETDKLHFIARNSRFNLDPQSDTYDTLNVAASARTSFWQLTTDK